jgi:hypothetical protein
MMRKTGFAFPVQVLLWIAGASVTGAVIGVAVGAFRPGGGAAPLVLMSILFGNVVGLTVLLSSVLLFPRVRGIGAFVGGAILGLALLSGAVAGTALVLYLFPLLVLHDLRQTLAVTALNGVLAIVVGSVVYAYEGLRWRLAESLREVEEVRLVEARLREEAARAQLAALQARINPHFFFNTLNTISALLPDDPQGAEEMVLRLAELFRYTFRVADADPVPLAEELDFIRGYLEIERARYGDRLRVTWEVEPLAREARIPGLLLQPLVENAVAHGIAPLARGGTVTIRAGCAAERLSVEVEDDGAGTAGLGEDLVHDDHGLGNVRRRLAALYGAQGVLEILPGSAGRGTRARIALPALARSAR